MENNQINYLAQDNSKLNIKNKIDCLLTRIKSQRRIQEFKLNQEQILKLLKRFKRKKKSLNNVILMSTLIENHY